jgi:hypothetical protein
VVALVFEHLPADGRVERLGKHRLLRAPSLLRR